MNSPDLLKAAEEKLNSRLLAYTQRNRQDPELQHHLIEDLKTATKEFLEARRQIFPGLARPMPDDSHWLAERATAFRGTLAD